MLSQEIADALNGATSGKLVDVVLRLDSLTAQALYRALVARADRP